MIIDFGKHYVYRYIRLDKDEPFYIGIGTKSKDDIKYNIFTRSTITHKRNSILLRIIEKCEYKVEILLQSNDYGFIKEKEKEFIKLYGRINKGTGTLANMTDGGDGTVGVVVSQEAREKRRINRTGKKVTKESIEKRIKTLRDRKWKHTEESKIKISLSNSKPILQFNLNGVFIKKYNTIKEASIENNCNIWDIDNCLHSDKTLSGAGFFWIYEENIINGKIEKLKQCVKYNLLYKNSKKGKYDIMIYYNIMKIYNINKTVNLKRFCKQMEEEYNVNRGSVEWMIRKKGEGIIKIIETFNTSYSEFIKYMDSFIMYYHEINIRREKLKEKFGIL